MCRSTPSDLARIQYEWAATYQELAAGRGGTTLRRRLLALSAASYYHPHWTARGRLPVPGGEAVDLAREDENRT
ncbi:hypothetical protein [Streptomyces sp. NPDC046909]|uniref:hypothetical protein n=1 Tax=Streptomyces sp. NPDC046909 TaxID=3155617 RepID=UPI0033C032AF